MCIFQKGNYRMLSLSIDRKEHVLCPKHLFDDIDVHVDTCNDIHSDIFEEGCKYFVRFDKIFTDLGIYEWQVVCKHDDVKKVEEQKIKKAAKIIEDYTVEYSINTNIDYTSLAKEILVKMNII